MIDPQDSKYLGKTNVQQVLVLYMPALIRNMLRVGFLLFFRGATRIAQNFLMGPKQGVLFMIWAHTHFQHVWASEQTPSHNQNPFWLGGGLLLVIPRAGSWL